MNLSEFICNKRRTGRTTRLLNEAKRLAMAGRAVYVIARNAAELQRLIDAELPGGGIKCEPDLPPRFDWREMRCPGSHKNCVWLVDHYFVESSDMFKAMLTQLDRFDEFTIPPVSSAR